MSQEQENGKVAAERFAERAVGERSESLSSAPAAPAGTPPDPELVERAKRRSFTAEYKLRILREADACTRPGEIGALCRREGLYTSHLTAWRKQREAGALKELGRPRGRPKADRREREIAELRRRAERAEAELVKARKVIEIQGNVSALLEQMLDTEGAQASTER
jgi:transposase-like protein